jgi:hypothetical protein
MDVNAFWDAVLTQDAQSLAGFFLPEARVRWHCTNECFTAEEYIRANCEYPGSWGGEQERCHAVEGGLVTAMRVFLLDGSASFHVVSFFTLENGLIRSLDEYWGDDGPPPEWRRKLGLGIPIRQV